jgi:hypothetical protein
MLEACARARWIDAFCETGAFDADQSRAVLEAGAAADGADCMRTSSDPAAAYDWPASWA